MSLLPVSTAAFLQSSCWILCRSPGSIGQQEPGHLPNFWWSLNLRSGGVFRNLHIFS
jgi:hypothetical protein